MNWGFEEGIETVKMQAKIIKFLVKFDSSQPG